MKVWKMACLGMALFFCLVMVDCSLGHGLVPLNQTRVQPGVPGNAEAHYRLGGYYQERGRQREAIVEFSKTIAIDPRHIKAYNGLGVSYTELKDYGPAMQAYAAALALNPDLDYVHNNMGYAYMIQGYTDEAIQAFERAMALNSSNPRIHNNLGLAYLAKGYPEKALAQLALDKGEAWALCRMGQWYYQYDRYTEAMEHFAKALDMQPAFVEARQGLEASEAQMHMTQALAENPDTAETVQTTGMAVDDANKYAAGLNADSHATATPSQTHSQSTTRQERTYEYHVIKKGEYLVKVLRTVYGVFEKQIYHQYLPVVLELNPDIKNPNLIYPGQRICMPKPDSPLLIQRQQNLPKAAHVAVDLKTPEPRSEDAQS